MGRTVSGRSQSVGGVSQWEESVSGQNSEWVESVNEESVSGQDSEWVESVNGRSQ